MALLGIFNAAFVFESSKESLLAGLEEPYKNENVRKILKVVGDYKTLDELMFEKLYVKFTAPLK